MADPFAQALAEDTPAAAAAGAPLDPFADALKDLTAQDAGRLQLVHSQAQATSPDDAAEAQKLSESTGIPADVALRNLPVIRQRAAVATTPYAAIARDTPALSNWMQQPQNAAVAHDDLPALGHVEKTLSFGSAILRGYQSAKAQLYGTAEATGELVGSPRLAEFGRAGAQAATTAANAYGSGTALKGPWDLWQWAKEQVGEQIPVMAPFMASAATGAAIGSVVPGIGTTIGGLIGAVVPAFALGVGQVEGAIKAQNPKAEAPWTAFIGGSAIAALNTVLPGRIGGKLVATFGVEAAEEVAARALMAPVAPSFLRLAAGESIRDMSTQAVTQALSQAVTDVASAKGSGQPLDPQTAWSNITQAAASGALIGGVTGGVTGATEFAHARARVAAAHQGGAFLDALGKGVEQSKLAARLPDAAQAFIAQATKDGPVATVYAPLDTFTQYWQSKGIDPALAAQELTGKADAYATAAKTGEDLAIPTASAAVKLLAVPEHAAFFSQELRLGPEQMNAREATKFQADLEAQRQAAEVNHEVAPPEPAAAVHADIVKQLVAAGTEPSTAESYATLYAHTFQTLGDRAGVDPVDLFNRYGLTVTRPELQGNAAPADGERLSQSARRQVDTPEFQQWFGKSVLRDQQTGEPVVAYHGTASDFDTFDLKKAGSNAANPREKALFFSVQPDTASHYAEGAGVARADKAGLIPEGTAVEDFSQQGSQVLPVYLKLENPAVSTRTYYNGAEMAQEIAAAKKAGHDGIMFPSLSSSNEAGTVAVFTPEQVKSAIGNRGTFDATANILHQGERGFIRIDRTGDHPQMSIALTEHADLSSFLHETGHAFLEVLQDLAKEPGAESIRADLATLDEHLFAGAENDTEKHERFARGFEAFLMEGKAPSAELRPVFARFRAWLTGVYRSLKGLNVELTPEVRGVFDRLVASDDAIRHAQQEADIRPLFTDAASAGMSAEAFDKYRATVADASQKSREELQTKVMRDVQREQTARWQAERNTVETQVKGELGEQPAYRALRALQKGERPDGTPLVEGQEATPIKLSKASLAGYDADTLTKLRSLDVYRVEGGVSADTAAELLGFSSGDELVQALKGATPFKAAVEAETSARMKAAHGDLLLDGTLPDKAAAIVNGTHRQDVVRAELKALTSAMVKGTVPPAKVLNVEAETRIAGLKVRDVRPGQFLMAATRASKKAFDLLSRNQDRVGAVQAKQQELLNLALYREATKQRDFVDTAQAHMRDLQRPAAQARLGKAGGSYLERVNEILQSYDFAPRTLKAIDARSSLAEWATAHEAATGLPLNLPAELANGTRQISYKDLTIDQLRGVYDGVKMIEHLATLKNKLLKNASDRAFAEVRDGMVNSVQASGPAKPQPLELSRMDDRLRQVDQAIAAHTKLATFIDQLDGYKGGGPVWEAIMRPVNEAATAKALRNESEAKAMRAILDEHYTTKEQGHLADRTFVPAIHQSLSHEARLSVALNWGNEGSRQRVLDGFKWTPEQAQAVLGTLDARDLKFVQAALDHVNSFWAEIAAQQKRITGVPPEKVEASSWTHPTLGEQRGGYWPLVYDTRLQVRRPDPITGPDLQKYALGAYGQTRRGYLEARLDTVQAPIKLGLSTWYSHVDDVVHSLTHQEMLIDVGRLLADKSVREAVQSRVGDVPYKAMYAALADVAIGKQSGTVIRALDYLRNGKTIAGIGWNLNTALIHLSGVFQGAAENGPAWQARAVARVFSDVAHMELSARWVNEKSADMRLFSTNADRDIADLHASLRQGGGWFDTALRTATLDHLTQQDLTKSYTSLIRSTVKLAATVTWIGQYEKALSEHPDDEATAIARANQAVTNAHGGGQIKDLAAVQRGGSLAKLFTTFYTYGSLVFNQNRRAVGRTDFTHAGSVGQMLVNLSLINIAPAMFSVGLAKAFGGAKGREDWLVAVGKETLAEAMNTFLGLRELGGAATALYDKEFGHGPVHGMQDYEGPIGLAPIEDFYRLSTQIGQGKADPAFWHAAEDMGGVIFHLPLPAIQRSIDGFDALQSGKTDNPGVLFYGPPPEAK